MAKLRDILWECKLKQSKSRKILTNMSLSLNLSRVNNSDGKVFKNLSKPHRKGWSSGTYKGNANYFEQGDKTSKSYSSWMPIKLIS